MTAISTIDAANRIIAAQNSAIGTAHAALLHAREAIAWYGAEAFELDGKPVGRVIDAALTEIVS